MSGPLAKIRVLDLSRVLAGPWAAQNLADLGAEVIKIERPGTGDDTRSWGPPFIQGRDGNPTPEAAYFLCANRGKKSVALNIATPAGQDIVRRLAAKSDILLENYKAGDLARYGLGYDDLKAVNPALIYCSITGFGQSGPYRDRAGYDFMIQGLGGRMSITGEPDDVPGGGPQKVGVAIADLMTGMYATAAVLAALHERSRSGLGQHIDMALFDVQLAFLANQATNYFISGTVPQRLGNAHPNIVPYQTFRTRDGDIIVAVGNDRQFVKFCELIGCPELAADPRFATNTGRVTNRAQLISLIVPRMRARTSAEWAAALEAADVPCGPINDIAQAFAEAQAVHRGARVEVAHPLGVNVALAASPMKFSRTPVEHRTPPLLGQHTEEVLGVLLGLSAAEVAALRKNGIV
ncbi:MAG: CoA transferase [Betaproteobacteria bacterium]|nr:CoA transferase [Betaproteobacteria bacterium]